MKTDNVFKAAHNRLLDRLDGIADGDPLPSETVLSSELMVSRTTVRKVLAALEEQGVVSRQGGQRLLVRMGKMPKRFPETETVATSEQVERRFMEWMLRGDTKPGTLINELELARQFAVGTTGIREFLNRFSRFGLIEKRPNAGWMFKGFTQEFGLELFEIREMFELRSARAFADLPADSRLWQRLTGLESEHEALLRTIEEDYHDFSALDNRFHRLINEAAPNRFVDDFYDIITFIFHYHYQWNKKDEDVRNRVAVLEHLDYIRALKSGIRSDVEQACRRHLSSARITLLRAMADS